MTNQYADPIKDSLKHFLKNGFTTSKNRKKRLRDNGLIRFSEIGRTWDLTPDGVHKAVTFGLLSPVPSEASCRTLTV